MWQETIPPFLVAVAIWTTLWFALTLLETLVRSESLDLLGTNLFAVVGLLLTLLTFEGMTIAAFGILVFILAATLSGPSGVLVTLSAAAGAVLVLTILHSYLLIVRYSSVAVLESGPV